MTTKAYIAMGFDQDTGFYKIISEDAYLWASHEKKASPGLIKHLFESSFGEIYREETGNTDLDVDFEAFFLEETESMSIHNRLDLFEVSEFTHQQETFHDFNEMLDFIGQHDLVLSGNLVYTISNNSDLTNRLVTKFH